MKIAAIVLSATIVLSAFLMQSCQSEAKPTGNNLMDDPPPATFIPVDSANKMIKSYLTSAGGGAVDTNLYSITFNADSLRRMLNDETQGKITNVKIMFAHTLDYINSGHQNQYCGYKTGALTLVIAGFDADGNYKYYPAGRVMDIGQPCPPLCPDHGSAAKDTLVQ